MSKRYSLHALLAALALVLMATAPGIVEPVAASGTSGGAVADPAMGPHTRDELRHVHDKVPFAPANNAIIPRAPRRSAFGAAPAPGTTAASPSPLLKEVFGFAPYWNLTQSANWNYNLLSTVAYFGLGIKADGTLNTSADDQGYQHWTSDGNLTAIIQGAHAAGDAVVVVIKPWNTNGMSTADTVNAIVGSEATRQNAISTAIAAMKAKQLDGINVDFEGTSNGYPNVQANFTTFMQELTSKAHQAQPGSFITVDTYSGSASWDGGIFNIGALAPNVDAMFVMAYDMGFSDVQDHAAPNAPLNGPWTYTDTTSVNQYLSKAPANEIILGVPYYGYRYCTVDQSPYSAENVPGHCPDAANNPVAVTYSGVYDVLACAQAFGLTKSWDNAAQEPWASWNSLGNTAASCAHNSNAELYYDDANSLSYKYDLVIQSGIRGTGMWALGDDGSYPELWTVLKNKFATLYGYWLGAGDGGVFALGTLPFYGSVGGHPLTAPIVGIARTPTNAGYWLVASDGGIFTFGDATFLGSMGGHPLTKPIVGMAATPDGKGYWMVASDGGIFTFGDATFLGSMGGHPLTKPVVGMAATPDGKGYWMVASDGGIFTFGDATFSGSMGGHPLTKPIVGMASTPDGKGYWMVASDGGIFTFGDAGFFGSMGGHPLNQPIVGMAPTSDGQGYWMVASDGGIFTFGDARFFGSLGRYHLNAPIVGMAAAS